ncbi:MAG: DUF5671 domain-containing protein [Fimbriimonadaceae bacterium]
MTGDPKAQTYIREAKSRGASDEALRLVLLESGWSERSVRRELAAYYASQFGPGPARPRDPAASSPLDAFLYLLSSGTLISWVSGALVLASGLIDRWLPDPTATGNQPTMDAQGLIYAVAVILVTTPIYLGVMGVIHRRLKLGVSGWSSPPRLWVLSGTLLAGVATILGFVIEFLAKILSGEHTAASVLKALFALALIGGLVAYYVRWLKSSPTEGAPPEAVPTP